MLAAGLPLHVVALSAPAATTPTTTRRRISSDGLKLTADSLLAFQRDLEARGLADRVLVHVWSEFGRRAKENGSGGTDHGAAGPGFLIGSRVDGSMIGEFAGPRPARPRRQPPGDGRLPGPLRGDPRGLARHRRRGDHPGRAEVQATDDPPVKRALALGAIVTLAIPLGAPAARPTHPRADAGRRRRVHPDALAGDDPPRRRRRRARELRRG